MSYVIRWARLRVGLTLVLFLHACTEPADCGDVDGDDMTATPASTPPAATLAPGDPEYELPELDGFPYAHRWEAMQAYTLEGSSWVWTVSGEVYEEGSTGSWIGTLVYQIWPSLPAYYAAPDDPPCVAEGTLQGLGNAVSVPTCDGCERYYSVGAVIEAQARPVPDGCDGQWLSALAPLYRYSWQGYRQANRAGWPEGLDAAALEADGWTGVLYSDDLGLDMTGYYLVQPLDL